MSIVGGVARMWFARRGVSLSELRHNKIWRADRLAWAARTFRMSVATTVAGLVLLIVMSTIARS
jgi:uncharacterized BrkB/YihY/UPF0761 family membrane protein